jgi:hypothetical protein
LKDESLGQHTTIAMIFQRGQDRIDPGFNPWSNSFRMLEFNALHGYRREISKSDPNPNRRPEYPGLNSVDTSPIL